MPYYPPSPVLDHKASKWPREYEVVTIPISHHHAMELSLPQGGVTPREWAVFDDVIAMVKKATMTDES